MSEIEMMIDTFLYAMIDTSGTRILPRTQHYHET
jgi:hypothetical protein